MLKMRGYGIFPLARRPSLPIVALQNGVADPIIEKRDQITIFVQSEAINDMRPYIFSLKVAGLNAQS